jgi:hypothetical protein
MQKTAILNFQVDGIPTSATSVSLASEDSSYGIKTKEGTIILASDIETITEDTSIVGLYKYTFTVDDNNVYLISWKVVTTDGTQYFIQELGPFYSKEKIEASISTTGNFRQRTWAAAFLKVTTLDGQPINPDSIYVMIQNAAGELFIANTPPMRIVEGYFVFEWYIDADAVSGNYQLIWTYTIDEETRQEIQNINISEVAKNDGDYCIRLLAFRMALERHINAAQCIPVYNEQAKKSRDRKTFEFTFKKWNQSAGCRIYRNGEIVNEGYEINYARGKVLFNEPLLSQDVVNADYNFRWFSDEDLDRFLDNAIQILNIYPPVTPYTVNNVPDRFLPPILYGAAKDALRQLMMSLMFQEPSQVFGGGDKAEKAFHMLETLKKNYEADWKVILEQKKYGPYPRGGIISTPEYTLPGGRCISLLTKGLCKIDNSIFETNMKQLLSLYKQYPNIHILSQNDKDGKLVFAPINHIWLSGEKTVYEIKTQYGYSIRASDEHLFFVNNRYIPLMDIKEGDNIIIANNAKIENDKVKSITKLRRKEMMCDLEIFGTANLFANGIKCHNSRWFRYLFGGSGG